MTTPRHRPQQARSRARREQLLRAAAELLAEGGVKAVTHRSVAERAGVPLASTTYYFRSIDELLSEALRRATERRVDQLDAAADVTPPVPSTPGELGRRFVTVVIARPASEILAQLEVYLEAARTPGKAPTAQASIEAFERVAQAALDRIGGHDDRGIATAIAALVDGFAIHRLARPIPSERELEVMLLALRALFLAHFADDDELAEWPLRLHAALVATRAQRDASDQPR